MYTSWGKDLKMTEERILLDADIREPLFQYLEERRGKVRFLEEKVTGRARADIVMVLPDRVCGIEIKSDADTYARLAAQVKNYDRYYDENYIVAGSTHALHVEEHVPDYWGIITVDETEDGADFYILRRPKLNPKVKMKNKVALLWRPELNRLLALNGMHAYREKSKAFVAGRLLAEVPEEVLQAQLLEELFERDYTAIAKEIADYRAEHAKARPAKAAGRKKRKRTKK